MRRIRREEQEEIWREELEQMNMQELKRRENQKRITRRQHSIKIKTFDLKQRFFHEFKIYLYHQYACLENNKQYKIKKRRKRRRRIARDEIRREE